MHKQFTYQNEPTKKTKKTKLNATNHHQNIILQDCGGAQWKCFLTAQFIRSLTQTPHVYSTVSTL